MKKIPQDIIGDIAILKFPRKTFWVIKKIKAMFFLKENSSIKTVLEKVSGFSGNLRIPKTKYLAGLKTKNAVYRENGCLFEFNIDKTYFSPRLSNERKVIADEVVKLSKKSGTKILVMFAGVAPYSITIAKKLKQSKKLAEIVSNELNRDANEFAKKNIIMNKLDDYIRLSLGDAKKLPQVVKDKFDIVLMPRPNIQETFLDVAINLSKKGAVIFYHGFGKREDVLREIKKDAKGKIGSVKIRKAGDIGAYKYRWQAQFRVK